MYIKDLNFYIYNEFPGTSALWHDTYEKFLFYSINYGSICTFGWNVLLKKRQSDIFFISSVFIWRYMYWKIEGWLKRWVNSYSLGNKIIRILKVSFKTSHSQGLFTKNWCCQSEGYIHTYIDHIEIEKTLCTWKNDKKLKKILIVSMFKWRFQVDNLMELWKAN